MNKTIQDLAWCSLPKEFKEEVKRLYNIANKDIDELKVAYKLEYLFGRHNLTSDAEGEEMLTVPRSKVQELYRDYCAERDNEEPGSHRSSLGGRIAMLQDLFGSKCLPDEKIDPERLVNTIKESIEEPLPDKMLLDGMAEQKPAEPKYHIGQYVRHKPTRLVDVIEGISQSAPYIYHFKHMVNPINGQGTFESDLEPYAELTENLKPSNSGELESQKTCTQTFTDDASTFTDNRQSQCKSQSRNLSQETANCDTHSNNSLTDKKNGGVDHFVVERDMVKELRLTLAAQILGNIIKSGYYSLSDRYQEDNIHEIAKVSMQLTDALIAEVQLTNNTE